MSEELKPCPFCGMKVSLGYDSGNEVYPQRWFVRCPKCKATQQAVFGSSSWRVVKSEDLAAQKSVIEAWNTRNGGE